MSDIKAGTLAEVFVSLEAAFAAEGYAIGQLLRERANPSNVVRVCGYIRAHNSDDPTAVDTVWGHRACLDLRVEDADGKRHSVMCPGYDYERVD